MPEALRRWPGLPPVERGEPAISESIVSLTGAIEEVVGKKSKPGSFRECRDLSDRTETLPLSRTTYRSDSVDRHDCGYGYETLGGRVSCYILGVALTELSH